MNVGDTVKTKCDTAAEAFDFPVPGQTTACRLDMGTELTIVRQLGTYARVRSVHTGKEYVVDQGDLFLVMPVTSDPLADVFPFTSPAPAPSNRVCVCSPNQLLWGGCKCGGR